MFDTCIEWTTLRAQAFSYRMATVAIYFIKQFITLAQIAIIVRDSLSFSPHRVVSIDPFSWGKHFSFIEPELNETEKEDEEEEEEREKINKKTIQLF